MRNPSTRIAAALAVAALCACPTIAKAQVAGNPIKGIDVFVGKKAGGALAAHGVTSANGSADLGLLPMGQYTVTFALPKDASATTLRLTSGTVTINGTSVTITGATVTITGATAPVTASWDFATGRPVIPAGAASRKQTAGQVSDISFTTDGHQDVVIHVEAQSTAVNTSHSIIKHNLAVDSMPGGTLHCTVNGVLCTPAQVKQLAAEVAPALNALVPTNSRALTLDKNGSTLLCGGNPCTSAHLKMLQDGARAVTAKGINGS